MLNWRSQHYWTKYYTLSIRESGGIINSTIERAAGEGSILSNDVSLQMENCGYIKMLNSRARSKNECGQTV